MTADPLLCACADARALSRETGREARCLLCRAWVRDPAPPPPPTTRVFRAPVRPPAAPGADAPPVAARTRTKLDAEALELARVRLLLSALRPDCVEPLLPPPKELTAAPGVHIRDPQAGWGDVPAALGETGTIRRQAPAGAALLAAEVLERIGLLAEDARAVCLWLREHGELLDAKRRLCLRGLYVDAGRAFAGAELAALWGRDLTAQRDGAASLGRRVVLAAATAWEGE